MLAAILQMGYRARSDAGAFADKEHQRHRLDPKLYTAALFTGDVLSKLANPKEQANGMQKR